jgi:ACS family hexuronate transporter-like MFS transporter
MFRWRVAILVSVAIAISYFDRQTLPVAIKAIREEIPITNQTKANLDTAFLATYGLMYLVGGKLLDRLGTRVGFAVVMLFWSLACASHGLAKDTWQLATSRLALGLGEGGGFPAATRAVSEWFSVKERSVAMGIMNAGTAVGNVAAGPLITLLILPYVHWFGIAPWRWVFILSGGLGIAWTVWWIATYDPPTQSSETANAEQDDNARTSRGQQQNDIGSVPILQLLRYREVRGIVFSKFLSDAAWYFYLFWLPMYLYDDRKFDYAQTGSVVWIPPAASGVGCLFGGSLSSWLIGKGYSLDFSRKAALGASAILMPLVMLVPFVSVFWVIVIFSIAFFGQQSWSTLVMVLPTDLFPTRTVGTVAGLVGLGGAAGGVVLGQIAGRMLDSGYSYVPVLIIAGSLHIAAFLVILATVRTIRPIQISSVTN